MWVTIDGSESFAEVGLSLELETFCSVEQFSGGGSGTRFFMSPADAQPNLIYCMSQQRGTIFPSRGDYHANCFLHIFRFSNPSDIQFNDTCLQSEPGAVHSPSFHATSYTLTFVQPVKKIHMSYIIQCRYMLSFF